VARDAPPMIRHRLSARVLGLAMLAALPLLVLGSMRSGSTDAIEGLDAVLRGAGGALGLCAPLEQPAQQWIVALRLWRALTAAGVGAALGLAGALVQGVFRNGLASPSVLGITSGASMGAMVALLAAGGWLSGFVPGAIDSSASMLVVPLSAFCGALAVGALVHRLATTAGQVSVPALLLIGIAVNTFLGGAQQLIQVLVIGDWEVSRSILAWTFGTLDDRSGWHAATVWAGLAAGAASVPFVARELDLMQAGIEDAQALGVDTVRVRWLALAGASLCAAAAVAVAGQIAFVGLVVPHLVRTASGASHRTLLPLSALGGAVFLLGADYLQRLVLRDFALQPGVMMSLIGGPFFVLLLWSKRREISLW
jgi:iron complex transport system permease protein